MRKLSELTRQELYDLVWSTPASKLAAEFGISDVALGKRCKKQNIPKPSLGYWAKHAAGANPPKKPLPPPPDEVFVQAAKKSVGMAIPLPAYTESAHLLATELIMKLPKARLDSNKRADLRLPTLPEVNVSKGLAERVAMAFHVILNGVESVGIFFRKSQSAYNGGYFVRRYDRLYLRIEETMVEPDGTTIRRASWSQSYGSHPSGRLCFTLKSEQYGAAVEKEWVETDKLSLEKVLAQIVKFIRNHFVEAHHRRVQAEIEAKQRHIEWERRHREWQAEEAVRLQKESEQKHLRALASAQQNRIDDLLKAAEWWRLSRSVLEFINECEQRWKTQTGELIAEQQGWLTWAKQYATTVSPFQAGYPDPTRDGAFDAGAVAFGGPYPTTRSFPLPPTMPKLPPLVA